MNKNHNDIKLVLDNDKGTIEYSSLSSFLNHWAFDNQSRTSIVKLINAIFRGAFKLSKRIAIGQLLGNLGQLHGSNSDGDQQKAIDIASHNLFCRLLLEAGAGKLLSEEYEDIIINPQGGAFAVAFDPIDGSGNIGTGAPVGTFFSIFPNSTQFDPFLVKGRQQVAAGYISYGHCIDFGLTLGDGLILGTMDPQTGIFYILHKNVSIKFETSDLAFNASVYRHLSVPMRHYIDDIIQGVEGPLAKNYNMRWLGSAVGELNRILSNGGMFFYMNDKRKGNENGRLRMLYEAFPIAFLCEAAGGKATDGVQNILDQVPINHHCRIPLVFGSAQEVDKVKDYHKKFN